MTKTSKNGWTARRKKQQAANCRYQKPWQSSTGPKTEAGKIVSRTNATRHGMRSADGIALRKTLYAQRCFLKAFKLENDLN